MAAEYLTLAEAQNYRQNAFDADIIANIVNLSPILAGGINVPGGATPAALPFRIINDRTLSIRRETTEPTVDWYDPGEPVTGEIATATATTFTIRGLKTRLPIPREVQEGYSSLIDQVASQARMQLKGMVSQFMTTFYYGDNATNSKETSGLQKLVSTTTPDMHIDGTKATGDGAEDALSLVLMDDLLMRMKEGVDMFVTTRQMYRRFIAAARDTATGIGGNLQYGLAEWGKPVLMWGGVPLWPDDYMVDNETITTAGVYSGRSATPATDDCSSIIAVKFGPNHLHGISFSQPGPKVTLLRGPTQDYDGDIIWITWDVAVMMKSNYSIGIINALDASTAILA